MPQYCDYKLAADLAVGCGEASSSGLKNTAYLFNFDDINWDKVNAASNKSGNIRKKIYLKDKVSASASKRKGYLAYVPGNTPYTGTNKALATGTYRNKFTKQVKLVILANGADVAANIIDPIANGRFVVVIENNYTGSDNDNTFEIYGLEQGLVATEMSDDKYSEETDGGWSVTLEEANAPTSGLFLLADESTTDAKDEVIVTRTRLEALVSTGDSEADAAAA